jgi:hypothetical protein
MQDDHTVVVMTHGRFPSLSLKVEVLVANLVCLRYLGLNYVVILFQLDTYV